MLSDSIAIQKFLMLNVQKPSIIKSGYFMPFFQNCASLDGHKKLLTGSLKKASEFFMSKCHASFHFIQIQVTFGLSIKDFMA
jgi:hypothetical protein